MAQTLQKPLKNHEKSLKINDFDEKSMKKQ